LYYCTATEQNKPVSNYEPANNCDTTNANCTETDNTIVQAQFNGPYKDKGNKGADITGVVGPLDLKLQTTQAIKTSKFIKRAEK